MPIDLVISDLDGTILETEDYHRRAYNALFREMNLSREWSEEDYKARLATMGGAKFDEILPWLSQPVENHVETCRTLYARKTELYVDLVEDALKRGDLALRPGVKSLFKQLIDSGVGLAVGSACVKWAAERVLQASLGKELVSSLATVCAGDDVEAKKPDPAIYLLVAQRCGVEPRNCFVIEDTRHGMEAAHNAGMRCLVTPSELAKGDVFQGAAGELESLEGLGIQDLQVFWERC